MTPMLCRDCGTDRRVTWRKSTGPLCKECRDGSVTIRLPKQLVRAVNEYLALDEHPRVVGTRRDRLAALNAVAFIGERVVALVKARRP